MPGQVSLLQKVRDHGVIIDGHLTLEPHVRCNVVHGTASTNSASCSPFSELQELRSTPGGNWPPRSSLQQLRPVRSQPQRKSFDNCRRRCPLVVWWLAVASRAHHTSSVPSYTDGCRCLSEYVSSKSHFSRSAVPEEAPVLHTSIAHSDGEFHRPCRSPLCRTR